MVETTSRGVRERLAGDEVPVVVVGGGPAGLTTAIALARHGIETLLVERRPNRAGLPRATAVSTRTMEIVRAWGLEDEVRAGGVEVDWQQWVCESLAQAASGFAVSVGLPSREQSAVVSPTTPACIPQDQLEPVLLAHLRSYRACRVLLGAGVVAVRHLANGGVSITIDDADGATREVRAGYLVAADGARSTVRRTLGIPWRGPTNLPGAMSALFHAPLWDVLGAHRFGIYAVNRPGAEGIFLPAGRPDRWVYGCAWDPAVDDPALVSADHLGRRIVQGSGIDGLEPRIEHVSAFSFVTQLADRFRDGDAFLVGDAAHRVSPRGGTGMNTAMHDGYDIGWKLAWVLRGWATPALLRSYEAERRPVVEHNAARSADPDGTSRGVEDELRADLGGRIPHVWLRGAAGRVSTLDLLGDGLTLLTGPSSIAWQRAADAHRGPVPLEVRPLDALAARALGIGGGGALLARADGAPCGTWSTAVDAERVLSETADAIVRGAIAAPGAEVGPDGLCAA